MNLPVLSPYLIPIAALTGFLLSGIWLAFFLLEDRKKPEPKYMITKTFILGIVSAFIALAVEFIFSMGTRSIGVENNSFLDISGNALIEEIVKFVFVFIFIRQSKWFDEDVDRMIYMIVIALGFATAENFLFLLNTSNVSEMFGIWILRFIGATLMHALSSAVLGFFWAKKKVPIGIILATVIHACFNLLILFRGPDFYPIVFLSLIGFIVFHEFDIIKEEG